MLNKIRCNSSSIFFDQLAVIRFLEDSFRGSRDSFNILWNSFDLSGFIRIFFVWYYFATIGFRSNFLFFKVLPISFAILLRVLFFSLFFPQWRMLRWFQITSCKLQVASCKKREYRLIKTREVFQHELQWLLTQVGRWNELLYTGST